jgi:hypothetical protein
LLIFVPVDSFFQAFVEIGFGLEAEQLFGFACIQKPPGLAVRLSIVPANLFVAKQGAFKV